MSNTPYAKLLMDLDDGEVESALSDSLVENIRALKEFGGNAHLKLTLKMELNEFGRIEFEPKVEAKRPGKALNKSQFVTGPDDQLELFRTASNDAATPSGVTIN